MFKKVIETTVCTHTSLLVIKAIYKNKIQGNMKCIINQETETITISDIECKKNNKGYGSIMMGKLIEIAKQNGIKCIDGWLSKADIDHRERLYHFYQKFEFEIISNDNGSKFADIKLIL